MKSIEELQSELQLICAELDKIKEAQKVETPDTNFKEIAARASRYPITGHPMSGADEHTQDMYMLILMSVIVLDPEKYTESFMTFYRIAAGMCYNGDTDRLMISAQSMRFETLDEITRLFLNDDKKLLLMLECMLIAGQFDKGKRKAMEYIAELASLLNINKEQITFLTNLARVVLSQDLSLYNNGIPNTYGNIFDCYTTFCSSRLKIDYLKTDDAMLMKAYDYAMCHLREKKISYYEIKNNKSLFIESFIKSLNSQQENKPDYQKAIIYLPFIKVNDGGSINWSNCEIYGIVGHWLSYFKMQEIYNNLLIDYKLDRFPAIDFTFNIIGDSNDYN